MNDTAYFYYKKGSEFIQVGRRHELYYKVDHFTGCRVGMFIYATKETGGHAVFKSFTYTT